LYVRRVIRSGDVLEIEEFYTCEKGTPVGTPSPYPAADKEKKQEYEYRGRVKKLSRLINANFCEGDLFLTLTFRKSVSIAQSKDDLHNFLRALRRRRRADGLADLKYISVTEVGIGGANKHHHLLINDMSADSAIKLWRHGRVLVSRLTPYADYTGLAHYITKENKRPYENRWNRSRNLLQPEIREIPVNPCMDSLSLPVEYSGFHIISNENFYGESIGMRKYLRAIAPAGHDWSDGSDLLL
jgi:hypothetical protein